MEKTLPFGWYTDPEILRREWERIFRSAWQYVGHMGQLAQPGYFAAEVGRTPVVVTRDREGAVRGFVNVCRHRGHVVASGEGSRETLQCPYHAWTYGLDGRLRKAPRSEEEPDFPQNELGLVPVAIDTWGPFLFANAGHDAEPLAADRTYRFLGYSFGPDVEPAWIDDLLAFDDQVGREDRTLVEGVQRGVASGAVEHGVLMSHSEQLIAHFQALTAAALAL